jgi:DNA repair exonuclease SbcCD nuclease subunit
MNPDPNILPNPEESDYVGVLLIGDPHLEGRQPGFRCDDYPNVILDKLRWCFDYARQNRLLPALLGDLFDKPRDNPTWMIGELIDMMLGIEVVGIFGNHDCAGVTLDEHDSLSLLIKSGCLTLVSAESPWIGTINERIVVLCGSSYRQRVPRSYTLPESLMAVTPRPLVIWMTHHDVVTPGYEAGRIPTREIENIDLVVNGHIHRRLEPVQRGRTMWLTPGNISRRNRSEIIRDQVPTVVRVDVSADDYTLTDLAVPHQPAHVVFYDTVVVPETEQTGSRFVDGLRELQMRRTDSGAGLHQFLEQNLDQFSDVVAAEILRLANQVTEMETKNG